MAAIARSADGSFEEALREKGASNSVVILQIFVSTHLEAPCHRPIAAPITAIGAGIQEQHDDLHGRSTATDFG